jgi:type IV pilus assembly protein PilB
MLIDDVKLKAILLKENYVGEADLIKAEAFSRDHHTLLSDYLLTAGLLTDQLLGQAISEALDLPYADLVAHPPAREQVLKMPAVFVKQYRTILAEENDKQVIVATDNPTTENLSDLVKELFPKQSVVLAYALPSAIDESLIFFRKSLETQASKIIADGDHVAPEIIDAIIDDAIAFRASDIHLEPEASEVVIRFRIDSVLQEGARLAREHYETILNRIKVQARMRIDEHHEAQDGAIRYENNGHTVDLRVSVVPTLDGEKIVMRVLAEYVRNFTLNNLGLSAEHQQMITAAAKKPFGMVLVTGPTGSGKTTTLYALLKILNRPEVNITTIEDPVEYKIAGMNQIQVDPLTNLTFAKGLKSILRQDPDIILVGEIRDEETSEIAINAALTGHLLFSTFHANDAATAIPRLLDMKIEPYLLASTLEVIIAQRLVRRICTTCRYSQTVKPEQLEQILPNAQRYFPDKMATLYKGKGCEACNNTGFKGRIGIFEFIQVTPELQELILTSPSGKQIAELARKQKAHTMFDDGIEKALNGTTTLEELVRVAAPPDA